MSIKLFKTQVASKPSLMPPSVANPGSVQEGKVPCNAIGKRFCQV